MRIKKKKKKLLARYFRGWKKLDALKSMCSRVNDDFTSTKLGHSFI